MTGWNFMSVMEVTAISINPCTVLTELHPNTLSADHISYEQAITKLITKYKKSLKAGLTVKLLCTIVQSRWCTHIIAVRPLIWQWTNFLAPYTGSAHCRTCCLLPNLHQYQILFYDRQKCARVIKQSLLSRLSNRSPSSIGHPRDSDECLKFILLQLNYLLCCWITYTHMST